MMEKKRLKKQNPSTYVKIRTVKDIHLIGILKKILKVLIRKVNGRNVAYVMGILMMMDLVIFYTYKKHQIIKKLDVTYVEKMKI